MARILPAGDAFRDPALELGHFRVVAVVGHQAVAEHIGKDEDAAGVRLLVVGEPEGEEGLRVQSRRYGVDFLDDGTDARVVARQSRTASSIEMPLRLRTAL